MLRLFSALLTLVAILGFLWFGLAEQPTVPQNKATVDFHRGGLSSDNEAVGAGLEKRIRNNLSHLPFPSATRVRSHPPDEIEVAVTVKTSLPRPFLNVSARLTVHKRRLHLSHLQLGRFSLSPGPFARLLSAWLPAGLADPATSDQGLRIAAAHFSRPIPSFPWRAFLADPARLEVYYQALARWSRRSTRQQSLLEAFRHLFRIARQRSGDQTAAKENRALLEVLAASALGKDPAILFGLSYRPFHPVHLSLRGRNDLAQHFLVSAVVASSTDPALSNALGIHKEFSDFNTGSGFSFSDLAADKAGTKFGTLAVTHPRYLQSLMVRARSEAWFMPSIRGLPDHLSRREFQQRFGESNSTAYARLIQLIERRIAACPLYRH